jgi:hypothetical protein
MMRGGHKSAEDAAKAAYRAIERRVARGYWPRARAWFHYGPGINKDSWVLEVELFHDKPPRPSDSSRYNFLFPCASEQVALSAMETLQAKFFTVAGPSARSGAVKSAADIIRQNHGKKI